MTPIAEANDTGSGKSLNAMANEVAHEIWAMSQGPASIEEAVVPIIAALVEFAKNAKDAK